MTNENQLFKAKIVLVAEGEEEKVYNHDISAKTADEAIREAADKAIEHAAATDFDFKRIDFRVYPAEDRRNAVNIFRP